MDKKSNTLDSKLIMYSAVAVGVIGASQAQAQIYHTDVDPDKTVNVNDSFLLDLNNDGVMDFNLKVAQVNTTSTTYGMNIIANIDYAMISPLNGNEVLAQSNYISYSSYSSGVAALNMNDEIKKTPNNSMYWTSSSYGVLNADGDVKIMMGSVTYYSFDVDMGFFKGVQDKFIGLKLKEVVNGDTLVHFGWVRVDVAADAKSLVVKEYGFEYHDEKTILAGASTSSLSEAKLENVSTYLRNRELIVNNGNETEIQLRILDINGREVLNRELNEQSSQIDLSAQARGLYLVQLMADGKKQQQKIFLR
jgi:hypothetical protein